MAPDAAQAEMERDETPAAPPPAAGFGRRRSRLLRELSTAPNLLSIVRIGLMYAAAALFVAGFPIVAVSLGLAAGISDYLDGYIARKTGQVTELGAILDRASDLIMETTSLTLAVYFQVISPLFLLLYLLREIIVLSVRIYCAGFGISMPASIFGKLKSNFLGYAAIPLFLGLAGVLPYDWAPRVLKTLAIVGITGGLIWGYIAGGLYVRTFVRTYDRARE